MHIKVDYGKALKVLFFVNMYLPKVMLGPNPGIAASEGNYSRKVFQIRAYKSN